MYFACARSERYSVENNFRIMPKPHARCMFKTIYKTRGVTLTNNYTLYPRLAEVISSQVEKSEKII